jgi:AcrR family transcriptional regulator
MSRATRSLPPRDLPVAAQLIAAGRVSDPASARGRLLREALALFARRGYARTTVRDLARAVGIQSGSLFHHFSTKEDIFCAALGEAIVLNTELMRSAAERARTPRARLRCLLRAELDFIHGESGGALALLFHEWHALSDANRSRLLALREQYEGLWLRVLSEAARAGLIRLDAHLARRFVAGALSWTYNWYDPKGELDLDDLADAALTLLAPAPARA